MVAEHSSEGHVTLLGEGHATKKTGLWSVTTKRSKICIYFYVGLPES